MDTQMTVQQAMDLLKLQEPLTEQKVKAAYYTLQKRNHPDMNLSFDTVEMSKKINVAHDVLKKELEYRGSRYYKEENLFTIKKDIKNKMYIMIYVDEDELGDVPFFYHTYLINLYDVYETHMQMVEDSSSKREMENVKKVFEENIFQKMNYYDDCFFSVNPHLKPKKKKKFRSVSEQLFFYRNLVKKYEAENQSQIIHVVENTLEYRLFQEILGLNPNDLNEIIIEKVRLVINEQSQRIEDADIREMVIEFLRNSIKEEQSGKCFLSLVNFLKEAEAVRLLYALLEKFSSKVYTNRLFLKEVINLSSQREKYSLNSSLLEVYQNITFDRDSYLENVWNHMSNFLGMKMSEKNFVRNRNINMYLDYMLEILELASNGIIAADTLIELEQALWFDNASEDALQYALNICTPSTDPIINPDYLFIGLEENRENPFLILHRLKKSYEILFENELGMFQRMEMKKPTLKKITHYLPVRRIFLDGDFIGKKIGDLDVLYLYNGFYLTMDYYGKTVLYKEEHLDFRKFIDGDPKLSDPDEVLLILCDQANEKYRDFIDQKTEYTKKKVKVPL